MLFLQTCLKHSSCYFRTLSHIICRDCHKSFAETLHVIFEHYPVSFAETVTSYFQRLFKSFAETLISHLQDSHKSFAENTIRNAHAKINRDIICSLSVLFQQFLMFFQMYLLLAITVLIC